MDSLRPAICLWQSMSREITQRFYFPSYKMYPCSVAEKRARRWCHQSVENSGNRFDYHLVKTKPNLDDRQDFNGTSINWENSGRFTVSPDGKRAKKTKQNNILWKKSNHTACVKWGILLFWFRVLAHFAILIFPSLKLRIEKSKWHNELHREKAQFIGEIFEALLWQSTFIFQIAENWHSFIHNWSSLTTIQLGQLHTSTSHYLNNPISSFSSQQVSNNWFNSSQLQ